MKICMVAYTYYESDGRVMRYADALAARGDHVDVICLRSEEGDTDTTINGVNVFKIQTRICNEKSQWTYLVRLLTFLCRSAWSVAQRHRRLHYDLIHVHSVPDFLVLAALLPRLTGAKVILDIHDLLPELYVSKFPSMHCSLVFAFLLLVERASARVAHHVIAANDLWRTRLVARSVPENRCTSLLNFPDRNIFYRSGKTRSNGRFVFLYPGTLSWHQGLDIAIRAFSRIHDRVPHADFQIYGVGSERQNLIDLVRELNLDGRVQIHDPVPLLKIVNIMENADVGVVPKRGDSFGNEAFSTKTLEFMALGVPLIVAATAIDKYYYNDALVRFFRCGDEEDLAAAMLQLITDPGLHKQFARNGLEFAALNDWEHKKELYLDIVNSLVSQAQPTRSTSSRWCMNYRLRPGDIVEVRTASEILRTLDSNGTLDGLPFMPEMLEFCGRRYRVFKRVVQATMDGMPLRKESNVREFRNNDVVLLKDLRCSGIDHGGCQRGCTIYWKEAWLAKVEDAMTQSNPVSEDRDGLRSRLRTQSESKAYFCQSSEFQNATNHLPHLQRFEKCLSAVRAGNCSLTGLVKGLVIWSWWKARHKLFGVYPRGDRRPTPVESLGLQPGEMVEVKPLAEIIDTLDKNGKNRGLHFSGDMLPFCGRQFRVRSRADRLITEGAGQMRGLPNTVILEGVTCDGFYYAFGGCPRMDFQYWREIWLKRVEATESKNRPDVPGEASRVSMPIG